MNEFCLELVENCYLAILLQFSPIVSRIVVHNEKQFK